jgi:hypothetical protein
VRRDTPLAGFSHAFPGDFRDAISNTIYDLANHRPAGEKASQYNPFSLPFLDYQEGIFETDRDNGQVDVFG